MTAARVVLGPTPCHGCREPVKWLRLWDGSLMLVAASGAVHECKWTEQSKASA